MQFCGSKKAPEHLENVLGKLVHKADAARDEERGECVWKKGDGKGEWGEEGGGR
jgi:hypothetical protein